MGTRSVARTAGLAVVCALSLSGCALDTVAAAGAEGAVDAQAAAAGQRELVLVHDAAARVTLAQVASAATDYAALSSGSTVGFAAQFSATEVPVRQELSTLTDSSAGIVVGPGDCFVVDLPAGTPTAEPC